MTQQSNQPAAAPAYPPWHYNPMQLSLAEIATPATVLSQFFRQYNLPDLRACLGLWLADALEGNDAGAAATMQLHNDVVKALEAAWLLIQEQKID